MKYQWHYFGPDNFSTRALNRAWLRTVPCKSWNGVWPIEIPRCTDLDSVQGSTWQTKLHWKDNCIENLIWEVQLSFEVACSVWHLWEVFDEPLWASLDISVDFVEKQKEQTRTSLCVELLTRASSVLQSLRSISGLICRSFDWLDYRSLSWNFLFIIYYLQLQI